MRVWVYIDGFNLYYRALRKTPYKWLNVWELSAGLLNPDDAIEGVRYFTARVSGRAGADAPRRQQAYLSALQTLPGLQIHLGRFRTSEKWRPIAHPSWAPKVCVAVHNTEEKGSDVNLATHLLNDAWQDRYDVALVLSQDTDLEEPVRIVSQELGKVVGVVGLDGHQVNRRLARWASFTRHITKGRLAKAQFPEVVAAGGKLIQRPGAWAA